MALVVPPLAWPGLGLKVSNWLGPPCIQSRMQAFPWRRNSSASMATRSRQVSDPAARAAADIPRRKSRRRITPPRSIANSTCRSNSHVHREALFAV